jgi:outer membrane receptor protein involved in Fe transport
LALPGVPSTFKSDTLTNYEVGLKTESPANRLLFDADVFDIEWRDIQLLTSPAGISYGANGGTARSRGFEANAAILPFNGWRVDATFSYINAVLTADAPAISGLSGDRLPGIPRLSGSLRVSYDQEFLDDWSMNGGVGLRAQDRRYSAVNNAFDSRPMAGFAALDLDGSVSHGPYTVRFFARNVTDKRAYLTYNPLVNQATGSITQIEAAVLQPRTLGIDLDVKF